MQCHERPIRSRSLITVAAYQRPPVALTIFRRFNSSAAACADRSASSTITGRSRQACRLYRPQNGFQQVVIVARASLQRKCFDFGDRNPGLAQSPLHALEDGESIFILADQGDADVRIFTAHVSPNRADRVAIDDRDHTRPLVFPKQRIVAPRADSESKSSRASGSSSACQLVWRFGVLARPAIALFRTTSCPTCNDHNRRQTIAPV
jgi:hypothetical protein